eukprot:8715294-Pyramimonas_sp.AAC.1
MGPTQHPLGATWTAQRSLATPMDGKPRTHVPQFETSYVGAEERRAPHVPEPRGKHNRGSDLLEVHTLMLKTMCT